MNENITASEALFGFAAWLTCRDNAVTLGGAHDASVAVELVREYIDANNLPGVRDGVYPDNLVMPATR